MCIILQVTFFFFYRLFNITFVMLYFILHVMFMYVLNLYFIIFDVLFRSSRLFCYGCFLYLCTLVLFLVGTNKGFLKNGTLMGIIV
jgi:hypothetical protein